MLDIENYPIIAAVKTDTDFQIAIDSGVQTVFLLSSDILTLSDKIQMAHSAGKLLFVHMDFVDGLSNDPAGVKYIASKGIDGIISTRSNIISAAAEHGLMSVQRFFMIDSRSVDTALDTLRASRASMVELMPAIAYKAIERISHASKLPVIAGGLIEQKDEIFKALGAGASMISTGKRELWNE